MEEEWMLHGAYLVTLRNSSDFKTTQTEMGLQ